jgi:uncharacterized membrane protein
MIFPVNKNNIKGLLGSVALLYPVVVFLSVVVFKIEPNRLSIFIVFFAALYFVMIMSNPGKKKILMFISPALLFLIGTAGFFLDAPIVQRLFPLAAGKSNYVIKFYPVLTNTAYFILFFTTLIFPPTLAFDISLLLDKRIMGTAAQKPMELFCKKASIVWCVFFIIDAIIAAFTVFVDDPNNTVWVIYNTAVTYGIMGIIFVVQVVLGKILIKKSLPPATPHLS